MKKQKKTQKKKEKETKEKGKRILDQTYEYHRIRRMRASERKLLQNGPCLRERGYHTRKRRLCERHQEHASIGMAQYAPVEIL